MNSLRARLILGSFLVAVIPLALAMALLSRRIESTLRTQSGVRLGSTLGGLSVELKDRGDRLGEQLRILGRDPALKRLYLVRASGRQDLADYLAERRVLLDLDFLEVADTSGAVIADGAGSGPGVAVGHADFVRILRAGLRELPGPRLERIESGSALAMASCRAIRYEGAVAGVVHGGVLLDRGFLARLKASSDVDLVLCDPNGRAVASTFAPDREIAGAPEGSASRVAIGDRSYLGRAMPLEFGDSTRATIAGYVSTAAADQTIATLRMASALLGVVGLALAVLLGTLWSSQISKPVERLAAFSEKLSHGEWEEPLTMHSVRELQTLVAALDRMRRDLRVYRERLVVGERHAAWSQMARRVAHEIKNPLTPIAVSVADLKRSYDQQRADFPEILAQAVRTVSEEIETLRRILDEFSEFGRFPEPRLTTCRLADILSDLETLYAREVADHRLAFAASGREVTLNADSGQLRQALVNLIKNALEALDATGRATVAAAAVGDALEIRVSDTGPGLGAEQRAQLFVPGFTTKTHGSGLGLTIVERIVSDHRGTISVEGAPGAGTTFIIRLPLESRA
jgi:two-component system nitrogen regulation sensor histidine kinase NtrY